MALEGLTQITTVGISSGISLTNVSTQYVSGSLGVGVTSPLFLEDVDNGDIRLRSSNKMRFGGNSSTTNFYIQYNSTNNSLDFVAG